jgi:hypothetical protein
MTFADLVHKTAGHALASHIACDTKMGQADYLTWQSVQRIPDNATILDGCHQGARGGGMLKCRLGHKTQRAPELISKRYHLA